MTAPTPETILTALEEHLDRRRWGAPPAIFFIEQADGGVAPRPSLPVPRNFWRTGNSPAERLAVFVHIMCGAPEFPSRIPPGLCGLCFFSETNPPADAPRPRNPLPRPRSRHIWATDHTGDIYDVSQTRGSAARGQVLIEPAGPIPDALRQFAGAFLSAPAHPASS